jgi:hypothetical protein
VYSSSNKVNKSTTLEIIKMAVNKENVWSLNYVSEGEEWSVKHLPDGECMEPVVGIDLGTSNSCVAIWHRGKSRAKVIKNLQGRKFYYYLFQECNLVNVSARRTNHTVNCFV